MSVRPTTLAYSRAGPAVLAAGAGWVGCFFFLLLLLLLFSSRLSCLPFLMPRETAGYTEIVWYRPL